MAQVTLGGNPCHTVGELPAVGSQAPDFKLTKNDLSDVSLHEFKGRKLVLNVFPSIDTAVCATSVRKFNERAAALSGTSVLCVSADLPFAQKRFCAAEGIANVTPLSTLRRGGAFGQDYGVRLVDGPLEGLLARSVLVLDENGRVLHAELVAEIKNEPDYDAALAALK